MKLIDRFLFGPPLLLGLGGWIVLKLSQRETRIRRAQQHRTGAAE